MSQIKTKLCDTLNLSMPILAGPMGGATTPELAASVANCGGLGVLAIGTRPLEQCEKLIDDTLTLTDKSVAVNLLLEWDQQQRLELSLKKGIKVIWFAYGDPTPFIDTVHEYGAKVILTVGNAEQARQAVNAGVDVIVTQGWEAGGHVCGEVATLPLVPAVVDAVAGKVPVAAAGGIADGRGLAAILALGADGVVMGTRLLASHEAGVHDQYKDRIINANETATVYTDLFDKGWPNSYMRVLRNSTYDTWLSAGSPPPGQRPGEHDVVASFCPGNPVERYSYCLPSPAMEGDLEPLANYAGQSVGLVKNKKSISDILDEVMEDAVRHISFCKDLIV